MGKKPKRGDVLGYTYFILYKNWPKINKKFGLDKDAFSKPEIKLIKRVSEYSALDPELIGINYQTALDAYKKKNENIQGLEIKCESMLRDDIIHECVHYIQDEFYNMHDSCYSYATEGLASLATVKIQVESRDYKIAATSIADYFIETKKDYKDYFGLPERYNKHIKKIIKEGTYNPGKRDLAYAKGFMFLCENFGKSDNYLHILIDPFKNSDIGE